MYNNGWNKIVIVFLLVVVFSLGGCSTVREESITDPAENVEWRTFFQKDYNPIRILQIARLKGILKSRIEEFTIAAEEIIRIDEEKGELGTYPVSLGNKSDAPEHLRMLYDLSEGCDARIEYVWHCTEEEPCFIGDACNPGDCTFSYWLRYGEERQNELYCWILLTYNENWSEILQNEDKQYAMEKGFIIPVNEKWCIVTVFGF